MIVQPYLLCSNIVAHRTPNGDYYVDALWHKDVVEHLRYIARLTLAAPVRQTRSVEGLVALPTGPGLRVVELPAPESVAAAVVSLGLTVRRLWRAIGQAQIVHVGIAGWPIPLGWLAIPLARSRRRRLVVVVESAPWRLRAGRRASVRARLKAMIFERIGRCCASAVDLVVCTQPGYQRAFPGRDGRSHVVPASWIDEGDILDSSSAERSWQRKLEGAERSGLVVAFCGRLHDDKGLPQLLAAVELLAARGVQVTLDILGDGDLRGLCASVSQRLPGPGAVRLVGTIPYGGAFFERLRDYHAIVVPSLSDEQPRIVFDAYSQAVPVLAADTPGLRAVIRAGQTGLFARASTPADWADLLAWAVHHQSTLYHMGCTALGEAHDMTHTAMHERRRRLLAALVGATQVGAGAAA